LTADWNVGAFDLTAVDMTATGSMTGNNVTASPTLSAEALTNVAGWTAAGNWTYAGGKWSHSTGDATALTATGETAIVAGTKYEITMTITTSVAGIGLTISLGGQTFPSVSTGAPTTYTFNVTATSTTALAITPTSGTWVGSIDAISVKLVTQGQLNAEGITLNSGQLELPLGNATYPAIKFNSGGLYDSGLGTIRVAISTGTVAQFSNLGLYLFGGYYISIYDLILRNGGTATLQLGNDAATATAQTIKAHDGFGTNIVGADLTIKPGAGTGSGAGGGYYVATAPAGGSGTSENSYVNRLSINSTGDVSHLGANLQSTNIKQATVVVTTTAAATATATNLIPAGSMVVGVTCRNTTAVTGSGLTGYSIGDGSDVDRWGSNVNPAINEVTDLSDVTITSVPLYAAATSVVLTGVGGSFNADATIRVTVHYLSLTAPST
jgi:hypothetical protein